MSVSAGKVLVKSENGNGTLKHREVPVQPYSDSSALPNDHRRNITIYMPPCGVTVFTRTAALLCNSGTLLLAQHFTAETVSANSINQALC